ncbi:MAG TPA: DUF1697 domain-containing protein [Jatrophihabitantaceae bacterium]|jgi:uncharacterized protein (DUF1697 family)|nr:DUF1697 domain-containing protein [Jatrophihabitantaceae bacterium]
MTAYIALLRGINVGGRTIKMADLRSALEELNVSDVRTVLASGNVVFSATGSKTAVRGRVENRLSEAFGYDAHIVLLTATELKSIVADCPFTSSADEHAYVVVSSDPAALRELAKSDLDDTREVLERGKKALYWRVRRGSTLATPFAKESAKSKYAAAAVTTRNRNTLEKVLAAV